MDICYCFYKLRCGAKSLTRLITTRSLASATTSLYWFWIHVQTVKEAYSAGKNTLANQLTHSHVHVLVKQRKRKKNKSEINMYILVLKRVIILPKLANKTKSEARQFVTYHQYIMEKITLWVRLRLSPNVSIFLARVLSLLPVYV